MFSSAFLYRLRASMAVLAALVLSPGTTFAEPSHGDYVGKSNAEITKNLIQQGYQFREFNRDNVNLLEADVVKNGMPYEIFVNPQTGKIVKIVVGDETNEIPIFKCAQRAEFVRFLADKYAENSAAVGVSGNGSVTELLQSTNGNSWTIIKTTPDGMACQVASGEYWQPVKLKVTQEQ